MQSRSILFVYLLGEVILIMKIETFMDEQAAVLLFRLLKTHLKGIENISVQSLHGNSVMESNHFSCKISARQVGIRYCLHLISYDIISLLFHLFSLFISFHSL